MVATQAQSLAAAPLGAGAYDFFTWNPTIPGIAWNILEEAGGSVGDLSCREDQGPGVAAAWWRRRAHPGPASVSLRRKIKGGWRCLPAQDLPDGSARYSHRRAMARGRAVPRTIPALSVGSGSQVSATGTGWGGSAGLESSFELRGATP